jgi:peroxiredoxin
MPSMEELYQIYKDQNFEILAVNLDKFGKEKVSSFVSNYGLTFPILLDRNLKTAMIYEVRSLPTTYIIGKSGVIKEKIVGGKNWTQPEVVRKIKALMGS